MKTNLLILFFLQCFLSLKGQVKQNSDTTRIYEFSVGDYPQKVKLIEYRNKSYDGLITTEFYKGRYNGGNFIIRFWKNIWNRHSREIIDSAAIHSEKVEKLMNQLKSEGIETIKNCEDDNECKEIRFLDGGGVDFKISTDSLKRTYSFQEIHRLKSENIEKTSLRRQAQKLVTTIDKMLNFESEFKKSKNRLSRGYYFYGGNGNFFVEFYHRPQ